MGTAVPTRARVCVLLSGGLDSTACLAFYLAQGLQVEGLFVDYGQVSRVHEGAAALAICRHFGVHLQSVHCDGFHPPVLVEVRGRNAFLLMSALMAAGSDVGIIGLGVHAGTSYSDCTEQFIGQAQRLFDNYAAGLVQIGAPFISWTKRHIWEYCCETDIPVELTYSCELGRDQPCGECLSCKDLVALRAL